MNNINSGVNGGRLISSFNLGGQGCRAGSGACHIYDNHGGSTRVPQSTYNTYNSTYIKNASGTGTKSSIKPSTK